jgi:anti-anti-sigma factor
MGMCDCERLGDAWVVRLRGQFVSDEDAHRIRDSLLHASAEDARCVVVNWSSVDHMDSTGFGAIMWSARRITARGAGYANCEFTTRMRAIIARIRTFFDWPYYDTEAQAIQSCGAAESSPPSPAPKRES